MPVTGPGGSDNHTHDFEFGASVTASLPANGHVHIIKPGHRFTNPANGHMHELPAKTIPGISQEEFDSRTGQNSEG